MFPIILNITKKIKHSQFETKIINILETKEQQNSL